MTDIEKAVIADIVSRSRRVGLDPSAQVLRFRLSYNAEETRRKYYDFLAGKKP